MSTEMNRSMPEVVSTIAPAKPKRMTIAEVQEKLSKKTVSITGTVSPDGLKLIADKESRSYKVLNPEFVRESAGAWQLPTCTAEFATPPTYFCQCSSGSSSHWPSTTYL